MDSAACVLTEMEGSLQTEKGSQPTDEQMVARAQKGDTDAVDQLFHKYRRLVHAWTRPYFLRGAEPEDLFQEGMIGFYKAIRDYTVGSPTPFVAFARLCIVRHVITAVKGTTRLKHQPLNGYLSLQHPVHECRDERPLLDVLAGSSEEENPETRFLAQERLDLVRRKLRTVLSQFELQVFQCYVNGLSYKETAERLQTRTKSIDNALCRIRRKLGRSLDGLKP